MTGNIEIGVAKSVHDLQQVLDLQARNHVSIVSDEVRNKEGFVTVKHTIELLTAMNNDAKQIIAHDGDQVVGYALVMLESFQKMIPVLVPMFNMFKEILYKGRPISTYSYYVMGQICVAEDYRGQGIVDKLYAKHRELYSKKFDCCLTEVSTSNGRSMKAHERVGFKTVHTFTDATDEWNILLWNWT